MATEMYRQSTIGDCLVDALGGLIDGEKINQDLAMAVLAQVCCSSLGACIVCRHSVYCYSQHMEVVDTAFVPPALLRPLFGDASSMRCALPPVLLSWSLIFPC
jgi:Transcription initiation factor IIA, gamma subunit, helical domain